MYWAYSKSGVTEGFTSSLWAVYPYRSLFPSFYSLISKCELSLISVVSYSYYMHDDYIYNRGVLNLRVLIVE
jgi:hypothetical protein